jgi:glutamine amidotransferase
VVGIVDYQAGNIQSIQNAFEHLGVRTCRVRDERAFGECSHVVLPGVGSFGFCAQRLRSSGLAETLRQWALDDHRPLLGVCVGMQLLADESEESPGVPGLGWLGGAVRRIPPSPNVRVPHVGWNTVEFIESYSTSPHRGYADFYFDHSYAYGEPRVGAIVGRCSHGLPFSAVVEKDNIVATQFHPEKSQSAGLHFLKTFLQR